MLYLIGCHHQKAQTYRQCRSLTDPKGPGHLELSELIRDAVARYHPVLIGEEASAELLRNSGSCSIAYDTAHEIGIPHRFCDPTFDQRRELSIDDDLPFQGPCHPIEWETLVPSLDAATRHDIAHRWPVREEFWIDTLGNDLNHDVLFISGAAHRWTFRRRLEAKGIKVKVIAKRVGARPLPLDFFAAYREVRRVGFAPTTGCFCVSPKSEIFTPVGI